MAVNDSATWIRRGNDHVHSGRPIDALLCFRRAVAVDPRSAEARFRLGETQWQLGMADAALAAWRDGARLNNAFVAPRLALAEGLLLQGDFAGALAVASDAEALAPSEPRARASRSIAAAASGDAAALATFAQLLSAQPGLALLPPYAAAIASAVEHSPPGAARADVVAQLAPLAAELPSVLLTLVVADSIDDSPAALRETLRTRNWQRGEAEALRRIVVAVHRSETALAGELATTLAAMYAAEPISVPSLWPRRTGGAQLRVAWLLPEGGSATFAAACAVVEDAMGTLGADATRVIVVCCGNTDDAAAALAAVLPNPQFVQLPPEPDAAHARALAGSDPDVMIDLAGLHAATGLFLAARPARRVWSLQSVSPGHAPPLVERRFASTDELARALRELADAPMVDAPSAQEMGAWWDAAVRAHQQGDAAAASAGYARILEVQPDYAPAHRLAAALARDGGDHEAAEREFAMAVSLAPDDAETRIAAARLAQLMHRTDHAAVLLREGVDRTPYRVQLWLALGDAELARHDGVAAAWAFGQALKLAPAVGRTYFNLGVALQMTHDVDGAAQAYQRALVLQPDFPEACFNLGVLFQQQGRTDAAVAAYRQSLALKPDAAAYKNLGEVLFAAGKVDAWLANFRAFEENCPTSLLLAVQALEVAQLTGDQDRVEHYLEGLRQERFPAQNELELVDALEELLFLLLNFDVEPEMLSRFAATYDTAASHVYGTPQPMPAVRRPGKLRIGYLSGDLRDHVMGKQMWQAIERHDRAQFALHFYATTARRDAWTEKFIGIADGFEVVEHLGDAEAAALVARDDLDLLVDLSTHTKGARPGILALKPARVQLTHIASCGTVGLKAVDFKLTDHFADLPENQEFIAETLLPMEGCVYPWRAIRPADGHPFVRAALGIDADIFVIGAFVSPLKLSRRCLLLWRDVLERIPHAKLLFSPNHAAQRPLYVRIAAAAGIAANRLLFLPQGRDEHENQSRYELVDAVLDTLPYGGVNGTMEALAMGVPVVTLVGKRHGERSGYSILANLGVLATVAHGGREYADIAVRLATDAAFMAEVRGAIRANIGTSALTDIAAHARHLEDAYRRAIAAADATTGSGR